MVVDFGFEDLGGEGMASDGDLYIDMDEGVGFYPNGFMLWADYESSKRRVGSRRISNC